MNVDIKGKDMELTDGIRAAVEEKAAHLAPRLARFGDAVSIEVEVGRTTAHHQKGDVYRAEWHVRLPNNPVYAASEGEDLYVAINGAFKEAERQVNDFKEMLNDSHRGGSEDEV